MLPITELGITVQDLLIPFNVQILLDILESFYGCLTVFASLYRIALVLLF
jgi:hypothetical protein